MMSADKINNDSEIGKLSEVIPSGGRILFVDDEENILRSLKRLFMDENYEVFTAPSGAGGLNILENEKNIGLIVSDQRMPEMQGSEFLAKSRAIAPDAVRILLTGYSDITAAVDAINRGGAARYISKPWKDEELVQIVRECMQRYFLVQENLRLQEIIKKKNAELKKWNDELQGYVQEQTMELQDKYNEVKQLNVRLRENFKDTINAFSGLLEMRDKSMRSHSRNVAKLAAQVAKVMNLPADEIEMIIVSAMLHDIGKIGIPDVMLLRDYESMDANGKAEYEKHPVRGQEAIDAIGELHRQGIVIRHHHERFDGKGFPDQLKGNDIPIGARIIAMADFVDKNVRKHQGDSGIDLVLEQVRAAAGRMFDPKLIPLIDAPVKALYRKILSKADYVERELSPVNIQVGMILARDVISGTGLLLLSKGTQLSGVNIEVLQRYYELDPAKRPVAVLCKK